MQKKKNNYFISVIIPVYNTGPLLSRAIESVLQQTYKNYEIIVIDDGSTDETKEISKKYKNKIKYFYQKNAGPASARNTGIKKATGNWIAFLDADDEWLPKKLGLQIQLLKQNPQLVWCGTNSFYSHGDGWFIYVSSEKIMSKIKGKEFFDNFFIAMSFVMSLAKTPVMIIKKSVVDEIGGFDESLLRGEDWDLWWRIAYRYSQIGYIAEGLAVVHLDTILFGDNVQRLLHNVKHPVKLKFILLKKHLKLAKKYNMLLEFRMVLRKILLTLTRKSIFHGDLSGMRLLLKEFPNEIPIFWKLTTKIALLFPGFSSRSLHKLENLICLFNKAHLSHRRRLYLKQRQSNEINKF